MNIHHEIQDARFQDKRVTMEITPDNHGVTIGVDGVDNEIIIDLSAGFLNIYTTNARGETDGRILGSLAVGR